MRTEKLIELQSQTEKNKLFEKAPEQSLIEISKQRKLKTIPICYFMCNSPDHFARDCPFRQKLNNDEFEERKKRNLKEVIIHHPGN